MTPNDLYSECVPRYQKRKSTVCMAFPLTPDRSDRFLAPITATQSRRGNHAMVMASRVRALLKRIDSAPRWGATERSSHGIAGSGSRVP